MHGCMFEFLGELERVDATLLQLHAEQTLLVSAGYLTGLVLLQDGNGRKYLHDALFRYDFVSAYVECRGPFVRMI